VTRAAPLPTTEPDDEVDERGRAPAPPPMPEKMDDAESEGDAVLLLLPWLKLPCSKDTSCSRLLPLLLVCEG